MSYNIYIWEGSWLHIPYYLVLEFFILLLMAWMCLILLNIHLFSWRLVLIISLSLRAVMICTLLHFPLSCWLEMDSKNYWTVVGSFLQMIRIQTLVLFLYVNAWFHRMLFSDWEIYYMLWFSPYCVTMPMGLPLDGKLTLTSNISYFINGWSERSIFNFGRVEVFFQG